MYDLVGLTNAITDVVVGVKEKDLTRFGLNKGVYNRRSEIPFDEILKFMSLSDSVSIPGGSPANVVHGVAKLGGKTALFGTVGKDNYGTLFREHIVSAGIDPFIRTVEGKSAVCYILVTPDGEKTPFADLGVANQFEYTKELMANTKMFHTSGYELVNNPEKTRELIEYALSRGAILSYDLAAPIEIAKERKQVEDLLAEVDVLFSTEEECTEIMEMELEYAEAQLADIVPVLALKRGARGSTVYKGGNKQDIPIVDVRIINRNGAGDGYAAGFLSEYLKGSDVETCGKKGSEYAAYVCSRVQPF